MLAGSRVLLSGYMNWGGAPSGTGTGARRSGGFAPAAGGGGAGAVPARLGPARSTNEPARPRAVRPAAAKQSREDGRLRAGGADFGCGRRGPASSRRAGVAVGAGGATLAPASPAAPPTLDCPGRDAVARALRSAGVTQVGDQDAEWRRGRRQANQRGRQRRPALADRPDPPWAPADRPARVAGGGARLRCGEDRAVRDGRALSGGQRRCGHVKDVAAPATRAVRGEGHLRKRGPHLENRPPVPGRAGECEGTAGLVVAGRARY